MSLGTYLLNQFAQPHGRLAGFFGAAMNRGNRVLNDHALAALDLQAGHSVLEIGFGGGGTLARLLADPRPARVAGIDTSPELVAAALRRCAASPGGPRADLRCGSVEALPWADGSFDRVLSVNSLYYWADLHEALLEIAGVLRPGGVLVLGLREKHAVDRLHIERFGFHSPDLPDLAALLAQVGLRDSRVTRFPDAVRGGAVVVRAVRDAIL